MHVCGLRQHLTWDIKWKIAGDQAANYKDIS